MKLYVQELEKIADLTLDCYNQNAEDFWEGTRRHAGLPREKQPWLASFWRRSDDSF